MSDSRARSSARSRATTGISLSPSRSVVTGNPFMPTADESATSRFDTPAKLARSGSTCSVTTKLSAPQSSRTRVGLGHRAEDALELLGQRAQRRDVGPRDADRHRNADRLAGFELPHIDARAGNGGGERHLQPGRQCGRVVLVFDLDDELRVVQLGQLGVDRQPEARPAAADEGGDRLAGRGAAVPSGAGMLAAVFGAPPPDRPLRPASAAWFVDASVASSGSQTSTYDRYGRSFGKNCCFSLRAEYAADREQHERRREHEPAVIDGPSRHPIVVPGEAPRPLFLDASASPSSTAAAGSSRASG